MAESTLIAHAGAHKVTRQELALYEAPLPTRTHRPIKHADLVEILLQETANRGVVLAREQYAVSDNGMQIFGVLDFEGDALATMPGIGGAMGFRAANDMSLAVQIVAGSRVFVCDNLVLAGTAIVLKRKHTSGLNLADEIRASLDKYEGSQVGYRKSITRLMETEISDTEAKATIFDMVRDDVLGMRLFGDVADGYFRAAELGYPDCEPRTAWGLHNSATRALKKLNPGSQFRTTMRVGKFFHLGLPEAQPMVYANHNEQE